MATYETRVENYVGTIEAADQAKVSEWATDVTREILTVLPNKYLEFLGEIKTDPDGTTGIALDNCRILYAEKAGIPALPKPAIMKAKFIDATSIHLATVTSPIYYQELNKGYVLPGGGNLHVTEFPVIVYTDDFGSYASSDNVPEDIEPIIVYGVSMRFVLKDLRELRDSLPSMPTLTTNDLVLLGQTLGGSPTVDISDPLTKAQNLIDSGTGVGGDSANADMSAQTNISGDDFTRARTIVETARQELERANTIIKSVNLTDYPALTKFKVLLENYTTHINAYIQQHDKLSSIYGMLYKMYSESLVGLTGAVQQR